LDSSKQSFKPGFDATHSTFHKQTYPPNSAALWSVSDFQCQLFGHQFETRAVFHQALISQFSFLAQFFSAKMQVKHFAIRVIILVNPTLGVIIYNLFFK
jgi:hypothetical protein